ncbi:bestrophin-like protein [Aureococcus anophagefferens]|uniref:Bestrophin-like protein n=1 Tax=Aureococcus anophagefferens TaxID=44056 RepID=A0ABR1FJF7_AURAN|nr:hypothetical protein JL721_6608 [Aureococcus anophagefferens]
MASLLLACAAVLASQARAFTAPRAPRLRHRTVPLRAERVGAGYLERLSSYSDEVGYTLDAPTRYSIKDWWFNLQNIGSSSVLERIGGHLVANTVWSVVVVSCYGSWLVYAQDNEAPWVGIVGLDYGSRADDFDWFAPFTLSGGILGILLAFRTGQSYDRFWEGRQVWARVVNRVRAIARASRSYATFDDDDDVVSGVLLRWLAAFPLALKQHLRGERDVDAFDMVFDMLLGGERRDLESADNLPLAVSYALSAEVDGIRRASEDSQAASQLLWWQMESMILDLQDAIGDAEAIAGTPVPLSYSRHTSRLLSIWTLLSPVILLKALPLPLIPPATVLVSWMLLATEEIGHIIEEPFGIHDDRPKILPLQRYCDIVGRDLHEQNNLIELARRAKRGGAAGGDRDGPPGQAEGESH